MKNMKKTSKISSKTVDSIKKIWQLELKESTFNIQAKSLLFIYSNCPKNCKLEDVFSLIKEKLKIMV